MGNKMYNHQGYSILEYLFFLSFVIGVIVVGSVTLGRAVESGLEDMEQSAEELINVEHMGEVVDLEALQKQQYGQYEYAGE